MVSSTKDRHGHQIAAAGVQEMAVVISAMKKDFIPCTVNLKKPIVTDGIDLIQNNNKKQKLNICMSNSFAFGGNNCSLVFGKAL